MKKISVSFSLFLLLFIATFSLSGQSYIGVFGGLNSSKLAGDAPDNAKYKSLMGVNTGVNLDLKLGKSIWLSFQPSYSQEGTKVSYSFKGNTDPIDSLHIRLNYFSLPLFLKVTSNKERFYALGGLETGILLDSYTMIEDDKEELNESVSTVNIAMHFGAGFRIPIGLPRLYIELRYTQGLVNLTDEPIEKNYIPRVKTNGFKILAGIEFPLKKQKNN
jgi:hypothetical protein